ncbi:MAG: thioredoxin-dependent thiol peroxidase [Gemmatimonadaceae bacterium]
MKRGAKRPIASKIKRGVKAPPFTLLDETGAPVSLSDFAGRRVVLFFFQKASTPGCTVEACEFRDLMPRFKAAKAVVLGVSPDTWRRHAKFRASQSLPYPLLADKDALAAQAYDVWHQKLFWGKYYMGVVRSTFVIGPDGRIEEAWRDVHHEGHAEEVRAWLASRKD